MHLAKASCIHPPLFSTPNKSSLLTTCQGSQLEPQASLQLRATTSHNPDWSTVSVSLPRRALRGVIAVLTKKNKKTHSAGICF